MELNEYQMRAMSTCKESSHNYTYMAEGLVAEVGEFMGKVAKGIRKEIIKIGSNNLCRPGESTEEGLRARKELLAGLKAELGDIMWFCAGLADVLGWDFEDVAQDNLAKLASRKQRGVIEGDGDNR